MFTTLRFGISVVLILLILSVFYPLIIFSLEVMYNPYLITVSVSVADISVEEQVAVVEITIIYKGCIPIKDLYVKILGLEIPIGSLSKGDTKTSKIKVELREDLENLLKSIELEFKLAGLYKLCITLRR